MTLLYSYSFNTLQYVGGFVLNQSVPKTYLVTSQNRIFPIIRASAHWNVRALLLAQIKFY